MGFFELIVVIGLVVRKPFEEFFKELRATSFLNKERHD